MLRNWIPWQTAITKSHNILMQQVMHKAEWGWTFRNNWSNAAFEALNSVTSFVQLVSQQFARDNLPIKYSFKRTWLHDKQNSDLVRFCRLCQTSLQKASCIVSSMQLQRNRFRNIYRQVAYVSWEFLLINSPRNTKQFYYRSERIG